VGVIKVTKGGKSLSGALEYVGSKSCIASGKDCSDDRKIALKDMMATKELYDKKDRRQYKHYIQSFAHDEITSEKAHKVGVEWANEIFGGFEVYIATHDDREHIHNHFIVNSVNYVDGKKLHLSKQDLENMKSINDKLCRKYSLSVPEKKTKSKEIRSYNQGKYMLFKRIENGEQIKSYVLDAAVAVQKSLSESKSKVDFVNSMNRQGYKVVWQENRKNVTFTNKEGKKIRLSNLEKTFNEPKFKKENMEDEFRKLELENRERRDADTKRRESETNGNDARTYGDKLPEQPSSAITGGIQQKIRTAQHNVLKTLDAEQGIHRRSQKSSREDVDR